MEGKKQPVSSCPPLASSSSLMADLFGEKNTPNSSSSSTLFHSAFTPASAVKARDTSQPAIFGPSKKFEGLGGMSHGSGSRREGTANSNKNTTEQHEKVDPCLFGSSVYYGDRDICTNTSSSVDTRYNYKKDGEDDLNNSDAALRGNWWQGSLYY